MPAGTIEVNGLAVEFYQARGRGFEKGQDIELLSMFRAGIFRIVRLPACLIRFFIV